MTVLAKNVVADTACIKAAQIGNLKMLKYLHKNGYPWDWRTLEAALFNGHEECFKYAANNGCSYFK